MAEVRAVSGVPVADNFMGMGAPTLCAPVVVDSATGFVYTLKTGDVVVLAGGGGGTVTSVAASGGTTGLSFTGSPITTTGTLTLTGTLAVANGGTGITAFGTGVATALGGNVGSAGAFVTFNGALGTPSSGVATNLTGTAAGLTAGVASAVAVGGITGLGTGVATALAVNVGSAGAFVTLNGALGTPSSGTATNLSGTAASLTAGLATDTVSKTGTGSVYVTKAVPSFNTTIGVGAATASASGAGISFPATQSASTDANTLDDYEEGTWTPTDGSGASLAFTSVDGTYTKIGNRTYEAFQVVYPVTADASAAKIASFPFTSANVGSAQQGCIGYSNAANAARGPKITNSTTMWLFTAAGVSTTNVQMSTSQVNAIALSHVA